MRGIPFIIPNIAGNKYDPGPQPNSPGNSVVEWCGCGGTLKPWPNTVPSLIALANNPGVAMNPALAQVNNQFATLPQNYMFIAGFAQKSQG